MKRLILVAGILVGALQLGAQEAPAPETTQNGDLETTESTSTQSTAVDESTLVLGEPEPDSGGAVSVSPFSFWDLVRMIVVLAAVVAIIYAIFFFLKKAGNGKYSNSEQIRVLGTRTLPGNRSVYLVQVGVQVFMLGAGGDSVTMLSEITDKETVDSLILAGAEAPETERKSFSEMIAGLVQTRQPGSLDLMRRHRERLQRMR